MNLSGASPIEASALGTSTGEGFQIHIVQRGDTLWQIARQYGVKLGALLFANPQVLNPNLIYPGDEIRLPLSGAPGGDNGMPRGVERQVEALPATATGSGSGVASSVSVAPGNGAPQPGWLARGATGSEVAEVQTLLRALGRYTMRVGGNFGTATEAAVLGFQRDHGLPADGRVGAATLTALRRAVAEGQAAGGGDATQSASRETTSAPGLVPVNTGTRAERVRAAIDYAVYWATEARTAYVGGASPFRFGGIGNGGRAQQAGQATYLSPKGVVGFDCSGLVVAMYRQAGIDLGGQGIFNTGAMAARLPAVDKSQLQPGDLLVKAGSHVVIYLGDMNGDGRPDIVEAAPYGNNPRNGSVSVGGVRIAEAERFLSDSAYVARRVVF